MDYFPQYDDFHYNNFVSSSVTRVVKKETRIGVSMLRNRKDLIETHVKYFLCKNKVSLLEKYGYTEEMAKEKCIEYGLLSPIYEFTNRGGCWFCPNARDCELRHLRNNHRDLWDKLLELEETPNLIGNKWNKLTQTSIHDKEEQFMWEDRQMNIFDYLN